MTRPFRFSPLATYLLSCTFSGLAFAQYQIPEEYVPVCSTFERVLQEHKVNNISYCGVAIPTDDPDYRLPEWTDLLPLQNMDLVKTFYYWPNMGSSRTLPLYQQQMQDMSVILPELLDLFWPKAEATILGFIEEGRITLQYSRFDIDGDGIDENVYRMTPLVRARGAIPPWVEPDNQPFVSDDCVDFGLPGPKQDFRYYVSPKELVRPDMGLFSHAAGVFLLARPTDMEWKQQLDAS